MSVLRLTTVAIASAAVLAGQLIAAGGAAGAGEDAGRCVDVGPQLRYLVVFDQDTPKEEAEREISTACGRTTIFYSAISVAVATSRQPEFADRIGPGRAYSAQAARATTDRSGDGTASTLRESPRAAAASLPAADRTSEQWNLRMIGVEPGAGPSGSADVVVGVLDSGVDASHPDLRAAVAPDVSAGCLGGVPVTGEAAWLPSNSAHGTHVAGTIAAADDGQGITGVAPGTRIASVKVVDDSGHVDPEAAVCGLMWAAEQGMNLTNSSFSVGSWSPSCRPADDRGVVHEAVTRAVEHAEAQGTLNVAAATNGGVALTPTDGDTDSAACEALPAGLRTMVTVSAVSRDGVKADYSSYGLGVVDLTAPGGAGDDCVLSTVPGGYDSLCGTSMAAPHVTGAAALLAATGQTSPGPLRDALTEHAEPVPCPADYDVTGNGSQDAYCAGYAGYNGFYGHGMPDVSATRATGDTRTAGFSLAR
ncbi:Subtilase family protein [Amycolatopsis marina]|uniref:Subtilase family protein n=1 Tax=Amycolatopsis marina TaxID=490629 RepID=A0A1I0ZQ25_9PSEU|nr:S8 family serine peptidase [Amycolatopsis marina]SFB27216.1 Subtilase family protein [Amycolatopsis marina]